MHLSICLVICVFSFCVFNNNNDNEILIEREPLIYTRARQAVQTKQKKAMTVQQQLQAHPWTVHQQV